MKPKTSRLGMNCRLDQRVVIGLSLLLLTISPFLVNVSYQTTYVNEDQILPSNHTILSADVPDVNLTYTTRTLLVDTSVESGDTLAGDHVTLKATWEPHANETRLEVHAPAIPSVLSVEGNETVLELDTRFLGNNATCTIIASTLVNETWWSVEYTDVFIGNFFVPKVEVITPNGGEYWASLHNITWTASDINIDDKLEFDVLFSDDSGESFEVLVESINQTWFEWDCSGLEISPNYTVEVRVTDGIYFNSDRSDAEFTAGTGPTTTTTTDTTTDTSPTTPSIEERIVFFVAILLVSSAIMAIFVYYAARRWF